MKYTQNPHIPRLSCFCLGSRHHLLWIYISGCLLLPLPLSPPTVLNRTTRMIIWKSTYHCSGFYYGQNTNLQVPCLALDSPKHTHNFVDSSPMVFLGSLLSPSASWNKPAISCLRAFAHAVAPLLGSFFFLAYSLFPDGWLSTLLHFLNNTLFVRCPPPPCLKQHF